MNKKVIRIGRAGVRFLSRLESIFDRAYLMDEVPMSSKIGHSKWQSLIYDLGNKDGMRVLEIGSREVTGKSKARASMPKAEYIGFDFYPGSNVDVVGDVHRLSTYFKEGEQFDLIFSSACFEHFAMPWIVAEEIAKMLKVGGTLFVETHFAFRAHERPWNFFQFSDMGLRVLFPRALGFECIEAAMSNPLVARYSSFADPYLRFEALPGLYVHSEYLGKKVRDVAGFDWGKVSVSELVAGTVYPAPKS